MKEKDMLNDSDKYSQGAYLNARALELDLYGAYLLSDRYEKFIANMCMSDLIEDYGFNYDFEAKDCNPVSSWSKHLRNLTDEELAEVKAVVADFRSYVENWEPSDDA